MTVDDHRMQAAAGSGQARAGLARLLVIDDNPAIHEDFQKIFGAIRAPAAPSAAELALFGAAPQATVVAEAPEFELDSAYQGQDGLLQVQAALDRQQPYALAFVDVRMPPGWDGIETTARIWQVDPDIQVVICTAYSDYSWREMLARLGRSDRLVILKKPFDTIEVVQLATALSAKWEATRQARLLLEQLEGKVEARTAELLQARDRLQASEAQYRRLNRIRAVIGGISSAMLRLQDRTALLQEACRVAATDGVFALAWAAALEGGAAPPRLVASQRGGPVHDCIDFDVWSSAAFQQHPGWQALQSGRAVVVNDLCTDAALAPLQAELQHHGYGSGAAFPLLAGGRVVAVLGLMAAERQFFDEQEIALLEWLAADLSFALDGMEKSARLDYLAWYDVLTGLPNARLFQDRLDQFVQAARQDGGSAGVVVVDLEHFTRINDTLGRGIGDTLLRQVGERFAQALAQPCVLGRIGSDTFAAASLVEAETGAAQLRDCLLGALRQPFALDGRDIHVAAQAGVALFPADGDDGGTVFKNAETALQLARRAGERHAYYSSEMSARMALRLELATQLREAIEQQQFVLHYQPRIDLTSGDLVGSEALVRWQHPRRGLLAPLEFIGLAEETGLIVPLGAWVLDAVCAQQAAWSAACIRTLPVAVNLSSVQFEQGDLLQTVGQALQRHGLAPGQLELELTESAVMNDSASAAVTLRALRKLGVGLALDDFGTGYSSLAHLKRFPFDAVKIDRSFVAEIVSNPEDAAIATAIIAMAHRLKLKVIAEGVETQGQFNYLRRHGCDEMQGHLFGAAVPAAGFEAQLRGRSRMALPEPADGEQQTLLLVDDEPGIRAALVRMLRRDGYRILGAGSGPEALQLLAVNAVQVIISDQRMPGMTGTDFLSVVKELYPDTVRIILSGYTDLQAVTDAVNRGSVFRFLTKPWDDVLLREQVRDAFRRHRAASGAGPIS